MHRPDFNCDTAARIIASEETGIAQCMVCQKYHSRSITCAMLEDWQEWQSQKNKRLEAVWGVVIEEAWRDAQPVIRLNAAIEQLDRAAKVATPKISRCHAGEDVDEGRTERP